MGRWAACLCTALWAAAAACAPPEAKAPLPGAGAAEPAKATKLGLVHVDPVKREIAFPAEVCLRQGLLEFLVCAWQTKTHESILHTKARGSHVHAALLLLGLSPGKTARWSGQGAAARFLPAAGAKLKITLSWKDPKGKLVAADPMSWIKTDPRAKVPPSREWVFVGSEVLPGNRYWADVDGEIISVTNFRSAVIDVPFQSSNADAERWLYANTGAIPADGTKVTVTIRPLPGGETCPDARALLEIDRFGRMRIDGRSIEPSKLPDWAESYLKRHERGMVTIRAAGRAKVHDVGLAHLQLRLGGVREFDFRRLEAIGGVLPRTAGQAKTSLREWNQKFANPKDYIEEPAEAAQRELDRVELRLREMDARRGLLKDYAAQLGEALKRYKVTTQPAGGANE
jgi:hypothetical protein